MKEKLDQVLSKDTDLSIEVDTSLIGGIKLRIENTFLDASIKNQINNVKLDLMKI
jgi:F0F1-type ATP synthase delta subunit